MIGSRLTSNCEAIDTAQMVLSSNYYFFKKLQKS